MPTPKPSNTGNKNRILDAALSALDRGLSVMPIHRHDSKRPLIKWRAFQEKMPRVVDVRNWFGADYPDANLGLITGELSRLVVLDCDEEVGLAEIERRGGLPDTVICQTRPDIAHKLHFYFLHPGFEVNNFAKSFKIGDEVIELPGLDFRGDGGYVMLPPSVHHSGAGEYSWVNSPDDVEVAEMPDWLRDLLWRRHQAKQEDQSSKAQVPVPAIPATNGNRERNYCLNAMKGEQDKMLACIHGQRHQQRLNSAIALGGFVPHISEEEILEALSINFGKDKEGAIQTIKDGIAAGMAKPRQIPPANVSNGYSNGGYVDVGQHKNGVKTNKGTPQNLQEDEVAKSEFDAIKCFETYVTDQTRTRFELVRGQFTTSDYSEFEGYEYPTFTPTGRHGRHRYISLNLERTEDVLFHSSEEQEKARLPQAYNLFRVCEALSKAPREIWFFGDELSVWLADQAGLTAVSVFSLEGEPKALIQDLAKRGASKFHFCFGVGEQANSYCLQACHIALKADVKFTIRAIPIPIEGASAAWLYERCGNDEKFVQALNHLPVWSMAQLKEMTPVSEEEAKRAEPKSDKAEKLMQMLENLEVEAFHTELNECYLSMPRNGHTETWPLPSRHLRNFCHHFYYHEHGKVIDRGTIDNVLGVLQGTATFAGDEKNITNRLAEHDGRIYIDLCDKDWQVIEIGEDVPLGWRIIKNPPVPFRRASGMHPLPIPRRNGKWEDLQKLLNIGGENWILTVSWLVMALRPIPQGRTIPYPVLAVHGEQESGKSMLCKMLRTLVDPNFTTLIGTSTRDEEELAIRAKNCHVVGFDNVSKMPQWLNDALCSLVTEGSFAKRALYEAEEETLLKSQRPVILNGINENVGRPDFRRRCLKLIIQSVSEEEKQSEEELWERFHEIKPYVLGLICDALCVAQTNLPTVELSDKKGLVDFAKWICAATPALPFTQEQFEAAYIINRQAAIEASNEADSFVLAIINYIDQNREYRGSVKEFRTAINNIAEDEAKKEHFWPKDPSAFGDRLNRSLTNLRAVGIRVDRLKRKTEGQQIHVYRPDKNDVEVPVAEDVELPLEEGYDPTPSTKAIYKND